MPASGFHVSVPASIGMYGGRNGSKFKKFFETVIFLKILYQTISHTFCP
ncbi:unnamed protein product [Staurois parvus]|uniref:Uncharacterized protein n=1 Tax=Staurois parvus TaxID=386267 RepID=A0ABN9CLD3_9NEOB|nr:unnamed protein product [Staurois parvus]